MWPFNTPESPKQPKNQPQKPPERPHETIRDGFEQGLTFCSLLFDIKAKNGPNRPTRRHCAQLAAMFKDESFKAQAWTAWQSEKRKAANKP